LHETDETTAVAQQGSYSMYIAPLYSGQLPLGQDKTYLISEVTVLARLVSYS